MEKNYVEIQGRFSSNGSIVNYQPVCSIINELMDSVSDAFKNEEHMHRMKITVEVEDLGADIKFGKPVSEAQHSPAPQRLTAGKLIPAPDVSPAAIDPAPEVVA